MRAFSQKERNLVKILIFHIGEALPLGALVYLHVGTILGGSRLKLGMVLGHGWVEHGSSQLIKLSKQRSNLPMNLLILGI